MSDTSGSDKTTRRSRYAQRVTRNEEDLQDWLYGQGQIWIGLMALAFIGFTAYRVIFG